MDKAAGQRSGNAAALGPYGSGGVASRWAAGLPLGQMGYLRARGLSLAELPEATNMWWITCAKDIEKLNTQIETLVRAKPASKAEVEAAAGRWAGRAPVSGRQPCLGNGAFRPHTAAKPGQGGQAGAV